MQQASTEGAHPSAFTAAIVRVFAFKGKADSDIFDVVNHITSNLGDSRFV